MNSIPLRVDGCGYDAAKFAVRRWHYSRQLPAGVRACLGVWEREKFIGAVVFGTGATPQLLKPYGLAQSQGAELVRVALGPHETPTSRIMALSVRLFRRAFPRHRLIVSFADPEHGHIGTLYQAGGWVYAGRTDPARSYLLAGRRFHPRMFQNLWSASSMPSGMERREMPSKYRYLYPLDPEMRRRIEPLRKPYPKRCVPSADGGTRIPIRGGGSNPTGALLLGNGKNGESAEHGPTDQILR